MVFSLHSSTRASHHSDTSRSAFPVPLIDDAPSYQISWLEARPADFVLYGRQPEVILFAASFACRQARRRMRNRAQTGFRADTAVNRCTSYQKHSLSRHGFDCSTNSRAQDSGGLACSAKVSWRSVAALTLFRAYPTIRKRWRYKFPKACMEPGS